MRLTRHPRDRWKPDAALLSVFQAHPQGHATSRCTTTARACRGGGVATQKTRHGTCNCHAFEVRLLQFTLKGYLNLMLVFLVAHLGAGTKFIFLSAATSSPRAA